jgi:hypothetical protein
MSCALLPMARKGAGRCRGQRRSPGLPVVTEAARGR